MCAESLGPIRSNRSRWVDKDFDKHWGGISSYVCVGLMERLAQWSLSLRSATPQRLLLSQLLTVVQRGFLFGKTCHECGWTATSEKCGQQTQTFQAWTGSPHERLLSLTLWVLSEVLVNALYVWSRCVWKLQLWYSTRVSDSEVSKLVKCDVIYYGNQIFYKPVKQIEDAF